MTENKKQKTETQSWENFLSIIKKEKVESDFPRKNVRMDADLHKACRELNLFNDDKLSVSDLMNAMVRSFFETNFDLLKIYRKPIEAKSIFDNRI